MEKLSLSIFDFKREALTNAEIDFVRLAADAENADQMPAEIVILPQRVTRGCRFFKNRLIMRCKKDTSVEGQVRCRTRLVQRLPPIKAFRPKLS